MNLENQTLKEKLRWRFPIKETGIIHEKLKHMFSMSLKICINKISSTLHKGSFSFVFVQANNTLSFYFYYSILISLFSAVIKVH